MVGGVLIKAIWTDCSTGRVSGVEEGLVGACSRAALAEGGVELAGGASGPAIVAHVVGRILEVAGWTVLEAGTAGLQQERLEST